MENKKPYPENPLGDKVIIKELESISIPVRHSSHIFYIVYEIGEKYIYFYAGGQANLDLHHIDLHNEAQDNYPVIDDSDTEPIAGGVLVETNGRIDYKRGSNLYGNVEDNEAREYFIDQIQNQLNVSVPPKK